MTYSNQIDALEFRVEQWDDDDIRPEQLLSCSTNALLARAAFEEAVKLRGERRLLLRHRARILAEHVPERLQPKKDAAPEPRR
ncbi:hypothetical protein [Brucella intermedia]|uniref:hypothetical protein n=1 Tax=Brucella intermedia TaxID=94625 RepID=UPI00235E680D|nr:hypothetical protein [Brucella intermedia]